MDVFGIAQTSQISEITPTIIVSPGMASPGHPCLAQAWHGAAETHPGQPAPSARGLRPSHGRPCHGPDSSVQGRHGPPPPNRFVGWVIPWDPALCEVVALVQNLFGSVQNRFIIL